MQDFSQSAFAAAVAAMPSDLGEDVSSRLALYQELEAFGIQDATDVPSYPVMTICKEPTYNELAPPGLSGFSYPSISLP